MGFLGDFAKLRVRQSFPVDILDGANPHPHPLRDSWGLGVSQALKFPQLGMSPEFQGETQTFPLALGTLSHLLRLGKTEFPRALPFPREN